MRGSDSRKMNCKVGKESFRMRDFFFLRFFLGLLACLLATGARGAVSLGIDELEKSNFAILQGKRVGLVTNPSGADSKGRSAIDVLFHGRGFRLLKLFGPEHGIDGLVGAGKNFGNSRDPRSGLPVYALYNSPRGDYRHPSPEMFEGLDAVVYDVQDLGNRSYTFISTLGNVMDQAAKSNIEMIVLDRPNPLGGIRIEGPRLDPALKSFVGMYNIPLVYGLTPGELARWINTHYLEKPCRLTVVKMKGWTRGMVWEDTRLRWIPTSPNIPTIGAARGYTATGMLGEIGIESGIGGPAPFQMVSGTGWDTDMLAARFNALRIPGVHAKPYRYRTTEGKWAGAAYEGVFLQIDPRNAGNLVAISYQAIEILARSIRNFVPFAHTSADQRQMFDKCTGTFAVRRELAAGQPVSSIMRSWNSGVAEWAVERQPYLLYGNSSPAKMATSAQPMP
jgi:uncharacterized protein YbbC (DUF1343 family)